MDNGKDLVTLTFKLDYDTGETSEAVISGTPDWESVSEDKKRMIGRGFFELMRSSLAKSKEVPNV